MISQSSSLIQITSRATVSHIFLTKKFGNTKYDLHHFFAHYFTFKIFLNQDYFKINVKENLLAIFLFRFLKNSLPL